MTRFVCVTLTAVLAITGLSGCPIDPSNNTTWTARQVDDNPSATPVAVRIGDMDGDGLMDVVSAWGGSPVGGGANVAAVAIHFQTSPTQWETVVIHSDERYVEAKALDLGDVNLDGRLDIVVAANDRITYLSSPENPEIADDWEVFDIEASIASENQDARVWFDVALAQIDGENGLDIVAALNNLGQLVWFRSPADPDSASGWDKFNIDTTSRDSADSLLLVDLNGDGRLDIVSTAPGESSAGVSWYAQPSDPVNSSWTKYAISKFTGATRIAAGDLDGDGDVDLAGISPQDRRVGWLIHPSTVTNAWAGWILADYTDNSNDTREPVDIDIADINGDGQQDIVVAVAESAALYWYTPRADNRLHWTQTRFATMTSADFTLFDTADVDADSFPDVVAPIVHDDEDQDRVNFCVNSAE